ncbi:hypothetical protein [Salinicoccus roseus]|uniref:hypothetical protein n=1 Tax=Salinicoccus roseus TaxID=45670 RepID=UPI0023010FCF|nr:hypothetical protein [Salinicoccus roseus]
MKTSQESDINKNQAKKDFINDYFLNTSLFSTFIRSKRYIEIVWSSEAGVSSILALLVTIMLSMFFGKFPTIFFDIMPPMLLAIISGFITLIAFSLSALALTLGFINVDSIVKTINLNNDSNVEASKKYLETYCFIVYRFYFSAVYSFIVVLVSAITYLYINLPLSFDNKINFALGFLFVYLLIYTISFTVALIGDCIKMRFTQL